MLDGAELFKLHAGLDTVEGEEMYWWCVIDFLSTLQFHKIASRLSRICLDTNGVKSVR
jgi:hypothetical protein